MKTIRQLVDEKTAAQVAAREELGKINMRTFHEVKNPKRTPEACPGQLSFTALCGRIVPRCNVVERNKVTCLDCVQQVDNELMALCDEES